MDQALTRTLDRLEEELIVWNRNDISSGKESRLKHEQLSRSVRLAFGQAERKVVLRQPGSTNKHSRGFEGVKLHVIETVEDFGRWVMH